MAGKKRRFGRIRKLPSGRFQVRYLGPDGADRPAPQTFRTKTDADRWLARVETQIREGRWLNPEEGSVTVEEWAERWFAAVSPGLKAKTRALYEGLIRLWIKPRLGGYRLDAVRPMTVAEWVAELRKAGLSASRVRTAYRVLSQLMQSAADNDVIAVTPCRGIKLPRLPETEPNILTDEEVTRLIAEMRSPHELLVKLLAYGGLRIGEAFALRRDDVLSGGTSLLIDEAVEEVGGRHEWGTTKSHSKRVITLPQFLADDLTGHLAGRVGDSADALLFTSRSGSALHYNAWRKWHFDKAVDAAGLKDVTPHDLRATHATWVADRHGVMVAAKRLGHSNASVTTRHYARAVDGRDAEVAKTMHAEHEQGTRSDRARNGHDGRDDGSLDSQGPV